MTSISAVERCIIRALLALMDAQLRQSDYLTAPETEALKCSRAELAETLSLPVVPLGCCGSWKPDQHFPNCPTLTNPQ